VQNAAFAHHEGRVGDLVDALRERLSRSNGLSLVATDKDIVVGHAMYTRCLLDAPQRLVDVQVLSPVGVLPESQRLGIGSMLITTGLEMLNARGVPLVFLEGSPSYYSRFGFVAGSELDFVKPSLRIPDAGFQVKVLQSYESWMTGTLVYSQTFWDLDFVGLRTT
jgi:putative acetyltransferase